jgi:hypothetical protein
VHSDPSIRPDRDRLSYYYAFQVIGKANVRETCAFTYSPKPIAPPNPNAPLPGHISAPQTVPQAQQQTPPPVPSQPMPQGPPPGQVPQPIPPSAYSYGIPPPMYYGGGGGGGGANPYGAIPGMPMPPAPSPAEQWRLYQEALWRQQQQQQQQQQQAQAQAQQTQQQTPPPQQSQQQQPQSDGQAAQSQQPPQQPEQMHSNIKKGARCTLTREHAPAMRDD